MICLRVLEDSFLVLWSHQEDSTFSRLRMALLHAETPSDSLLPAEAGFSSLHERSILVRSKNKMNLGKPKNLFVQGMMEAKSTISA